MKKEKQGGEGRDGEEETEENEKREEGEENQEEDEEHPLSQMITLQHHLICWAIRFGRCNVGNTSQKLSRSYFGFLNSHKGFANDFNTVVSDDFAVSAHVAELHVTPHMLPGGTVATFRVASGNSDRDTHPQPRQRCRVT